MSFLSKKSNVLNSGMVGRGKVPNPSTNNSFNFLSIDLQYTFSFELPQSLKFKASI